MIPDTLNSSMTRQQIQREFHQAQLMSMNSRFEQMLGRKDAEPEPLEVLIPSLGLQTTEKPQVLHFIFHSPCADGFGAAWAFYRSLINNPPTKPLKVIFTPENHRWEKVKELLKSSSLKYEDVICVDICPARALSIELHEKAKSYQVYDHHKTAMEDCGDLPYCYFDMDRSGIGLAWDIFCKTPRPFLVDCVEAGDLWRWDSVPGSSEVRICMEVNVRFKFDQWDAFNKRLETNRADVIKEGGYYLKYRNVVTQMLTGRKVHKLTIKGQTMPAVNCPIWQSGVGNVLVKKIGPCAAVYYWNGTYWAFSLRSSNEGPDVSKIAEKLGGGGHRNAAGFKVNDLAELKRAGIEFETYTEDEQYEIELLLSPDLVDQVEPVTIVTEMVH